MLCGKQGQRKPPTTPKKERDGDWVRKVGRARPTLAAILEAESRQRIS